MDRKKFQNIFSEIDEFLIASLCDDIELCEDIGYPIYTRYFFPPQLCAKISSLNFSGLKFSLCGLNQNCEKNMIGIYPQDYDYQLEFPIKYFKIVNKSKFKKLEHKDYLGSIMGLGIKRELLGDLVIDDDSCYGVAGEEIFDYIIKNLDFVGKNPINIEEVSKFDIPENSFEEVIITVASLRLDSIIASITNLSRTKGIDIIENGDVSINYVVSKNKSADIKIGDIITVRKKGKYLIGKELGESKKGKIRMSVKRFI